MDAPKIIKALGGPSKVAELLKLTGKHPTQRVQNWIERGIPLRVQIEHGPLLRRAERKATSDANDSACLERRSGDRRGSKPQAGKAA